MVRMRAISRLTPARPAEFSRAPVADWKRRLKSSCRVSLSFVSSSSSVRSRRSLALVKEISLPLHELGLDRELLAGEADGLAGERLGNAGELEHDPARLDDRDPLLRGALARAHAGLGRLLGHRLVREDVDPDLAAALDLAGHGHTGGFDLAVAHPAALERLEPVLAELHARSALGVAAHAAAVLLAVLDALWLQHPLAPLRSRSAPTGAAAAAATGAAHLLGRLEIGEVLGEALGHDLALVDPDLHADAAEGRACLVEAVVDVGPEGVQRHASVRVALGARHFGAAQPAGHLDLHALGARAHGRGQCPLHRAPEGHAVLELLGDRLGHEPRVELGALDLEDVHLHGLAGHLVELPAEGVHLRAGLADHDAGPGRVDVDLDLVLVLLDG